MTAGRINQVSTVKRVGGAATGGYDFSVAPSLPGWGRIVVAAVRRRRPSVFSAGGVGGCEFTSSNRSRIYTDAGGTESDTTLPGGSGPRAEWLRKDILSSVMLLGSTTSVVVFPCAPLMWAPDLQAAKGAGIAGLGPPPPCLPPDQL